MTEEGDRRPTAEEVKLMHYPPSRFVSILLAAVLAVSASAEESATGGGGASGESLIVVAAVGFGVWYLVDNARWKRKAKRDLEISKSPALQRYDDNRNARISCREARRHGIAPVHWDHPAYEHMRDRNRDGVVCEK